MSIKRTSHQNHRFITAKTIAFWDINACQIPDGLKGRDIGPSVSQTLANMNYLGNVSLRLYGDTHVDKIGDYTDQTYRFCGMPHTTILEQILVDIYGVSVFNCGRHLNILLIVGDLSKDEAIINAFSVLPERKLVNVLLCQPSDVAAAVLSSEVQLPPWEKIVETAFAICEQKKKEIEDSRKRSEEIRASYRNGTAKISRVLGEF
ncbi:hypothetical protein HA466_0180720 [Hirschfeldia incana]|nr:hypothetical protein HA466_0180720 [Hirschfeldia incana]